MKNTGFTLVELAIVIVIIGLLVGGVLQGQELIEQARIRSQIKQLEEYDAAVATFKSKYNFIPGDMPATESAKFGLASAGDGNSLINLVPYAPNYSSWSATYSSWSSYPESMFFFPDLLTAKLIKARLNETGAYNIGGSFPEAKLGDMGVAIVGVNNLQYYFLGPTLRTGSLHDFYRNSPNPTLTPDTANSLDIKLDDGVPSQGNVRVPILFNSTDSFVTDNWNFNTCLGANALVYNATSNTKQCRLMIKSKVF